MYFTRIRSASSHITTDFYFLLCPLWLKTVQHIYILYVHNCLTKLSLIVPQASLCISFKLNVSLGSGALLYDLLTGTSRAVIWKLSVGHFLPLSSLLKGSKAQTVRGQRCAAVVSTGLYILWAVGTHSGQSLENWHHTAIILNLFTAETGGEAAVRWMGKCSRHTLNAFLQTVIWNVGGLKHATLLERQRHKEILFVRACPCAEFGAIERMHNKH